MLNNIAFMTIKRRKNDSTMNLHEPPMGCPPLLHQPCVAGNIGDEYGQQAPPRRHRR